MADILAALMDLYARESYLELQDPVEVVLGIELPKYDLGVDEDTMREHLKIFADRVALAESSRNPKAESDEEGKAKGAYQWLTVDTKKKQHLKEGKSTQPAFQTGLNRMTRYYNWKGGRTAPWVEKAKKHNDPTKLTDRQQIALFLADIFQREGTTTEKGEGYEQGKLQEIMKTGDPDIMNDVYLKYWHTKPDQAVIDNARRSFY